MTKGLSVATVFALVALVAVVATTLVRLRRRRGGKSLHSSCSAFRALPERIATVDVRNMQMTIVSETQCAGVFGSLNASASKLVCLPPPDEFRYLSGKSSDFTTGNCRQ